MCNWPEKLQALRQNSHYNQFGPCTGDTVVAAPFAKCTMPSDPTSILWMGGRQAVQPKFSFGFGRKCNTHSTRRYPKKGAPAESFRVAGAEIG